MRVFKSEAEVDNARYDDLTMFEKDICEAWAGAFYLESKRPYWRSSYSLKHDIQHAFCIYMTDRQFQDMMERFGFRAIPCGDTNSKVYKIAKSIADKSVYVGEQIQRFRNPKNMIPFLNRSTMGIRKKFALRDELMDMADKIKCAQWGNAKYIGDNYKTVKKAYEIIGWKRLLKKSLELSF